MVIATLFIVGVIMLLYVAMIYWIVIFLHELGHLIAAHCLGMKPSEFTVGDGPSIRIAIGNLKIKLGLIPNNGEVRANWTVDWRKLVAVLAAGMVCNALTALFVGVLALMGKVDLSTTLQFIGISVMAIITAWTGDDGQAIRAALERKKQRERDYQNYLNAMAALKNEINEKSRLISML